MAMRFFGPSVHHIKDNVAEIKSELCAMQDDLARKEHFATISEHLASHLVFCQVAQDKKDPMRHLSKGKGQMIFKKFSSFLRHDLPKGSFLKDDKTVDLDIIARNLGHSKEEILPASYPAFDGEKDERLRKRGIIVLEFLHPNGDRPCWQRWEAIPLRLWHHQVITCWEGIHSPAWSIYSLHQCCPKDH